MINVPCKEDFLNHAITDVSKGYYYGMQREISPEETLKRIQPFFSSIGLTRLADITGLDRIGIPVVLAVRPNSLYLSVEAGKGFTPAAAAVSAAMECIERYAGESAPLTEIIASYEEMGSECNLVEWEDLPFTQDAVTSPKTPERWVIGYDIMCRERVAVPFISVTMKGPHDRQTDLASFQFGSNGLASGNNFPEAVSMGIFELIERDAIACWALAESMKHVSVPGVIPDSIGYALVKELMDRLAAARIVPLLFDCTIDTGVPVFLAYIHDASGRHVGLFKGYGAHLDPEIAMIRALTEAVQARAVYISGSRDDFFKYNLMILKKGDNSGNIAQFNAIPKTKDAGFYQSSATQSFRGDIGLCIERLRAVGIKRIVIFDLTPPGFPVSVVRVFIPGLEGYLYKYYQAGRRAHRFAESIGSF